MTAEILPPQAGTPIDFRKPLDPQLPRPAPQSAPRMERQEQEITSPTSDENRGRRRTRDDEHADERDNQDDGDDDGDGDGPLGSSRKRRRSRKGLDKKFECPHEGCGKSYSRAEHLYRHQLNRKLCPGFVASEKLTWSRQPKTNISLRLSRLPAIFRETGLVCSPQGKTHSSRLPAAAEGHFYSQSQPDCVECYGE